MVTGCLELGRLLVNALKLRAAAVQTSVLSGSSHPG
jgi:hypothetical protein